MDIHLLPFIVLFWFSVQGGASHELLREEMYWQFMLPNTSMPKSLHDLIQPGNASTNVSGVLRNIDFVRPRPFRATYGVAYIGGDGSENVQQISTIADSTTVYFLIDDLLPGKDMMLIFTKSTNGSNFLPRKIAQTILFSSNDFSDILSYFLIEPKSNDAQIMKETIEECEAPGVKGEVKYCSTSLKSLVDFVVSKYGKKVEAFANEVEEEDKKQKYKILEGIKMMGDNQIVCHKMRYPYAVFYCHIILETRAYLVPLMGEDGSKAQAIVVCHMNTLTWNPMHLAFQILKVKPGGPPICHFLNSDTIVWVPN